MIAWIASFLPVRSAHSWRANGMGNIIRKPDSI